jgi:hypothetical protein
MNVVAVFRLGFTHISSNSYELNSIFHCSSFMHYKTLYVKRGKVKLKQQAILVCRSVRLILFYIFPSVLLLLRHVTRP